MMIDSNKIDSQLLSIVRKFLLELGAERAARAVTLDASLERDLGIDSLGKVELIHRIEKNFHIQLPESTIAETENLQDLIKLIESASPETMVAKQTEFVPELQTTHSDLSKAQTLVEVLQIYAAQFPERPHIYLQDDNAKETIITYGELLREATDIARGLVKRGIHQGDTIAIMLPTSKEFFYSFFAVLLAGAIPVPIYPPFRPEQIEEYIRREAKILQNAETKILITFAQAEMLSKILRTFIPCLKEITTVKNLRMTSGNLPEYKFKTNDPALIQYTSGSTGDPKGVLLNHENMLANIRAIQQGIPVKPTDITVSWLPLYHDMGLMSWLCNLYCGTPVTFLSPLTFLTRPERWLWAIHYHHATLSGGPNFAYELCAKKIDPADIEGLDLSSWQFAFNGAEAVNPKTLERFTKKFAPYGFKANAFAPVYGLAESTVGLIVPRERRTPIIDTIQRQPFETENKAIPAEPGANTTLQFVACGQPLPDHAVRIVDDNNQLLAERIAGNLQFQGPSSLQGYYNNPHATQKIYHDGWWDTGDRAYQVDKEIYIVGRKKDLIIKAGRNFYPEEIEGLTSQVNDIRKGCVIAFGVSDEQTGTEKIIIVAETYERTAHSQEKIRAEITEKMVDALGVPPDQIVLVPPKTIPKTSSGKLQRAACKQAYLNHKLIQQPLSARMQFGKLMMMSVGKKISQALIQLGKLIYGLYAIAMIVIVTLCTWLLLLVTPKKFGPTLIQTGVKIIVFLSFCPIKIIGKDNIRKIKPMIFVSNHTSYVDSFFLTALLPKGTIFIAKKELFKIPIARTFFAKAGHLPIDRLDFAKNLEDKEKIETLLKQGESIFIFPEGTFTYATGLRPFKLGAFVIAANTNTPICPIAIEGARAILRERQLLPRLGRITITIGEPITPQGSDWNEVIRLHNLVRAEIAKNCGEAILDIISAGPPIE